MTFRLPFLFVLLMAAQLNAQPDTASALRSPVFKNYLWTSVPLLQQSDVTYQLWQGFRVLQEANAGNAVSQFELSLRYLTGRGFKADTARAVYWAERAAERNHLLARFNLAIFQYNGWGTEWNPFAAYKNFLYAAERNVPEAQHVVAQLLTENLVVPRNMPEVYRWAKLAADSGYTPAREFIIDLERRGYTPEALRTSPDSKGSASTSQQTPSSTYQLMMLDVTPDTLQSSPDSILVADVLRAAEMIRSDSMIAAFSGIMLEKGRPVIDSAKMTMLERYAAVGHPEAMTLLARMHETGSGVPRDVVHAAALYVRAVRLDSRRASRLLYNLLQQPAFFLALKARVGNNDPLALFSWAGLSALGLDRQLTDGQALNMLERSVAADYPPAIIELALCYYAGRWVSVNHAETENLLRRAIRSGSREAAIRLAILHVRSGRLEVDDAIEVLAQGAREGSVLAQFALGYCYHTGNGVKQEKGKAAQLYIASAQRGSQDAVRALEQMYDEIRPPEKMFRVSR